MSKRLKIATNPICVRPASHGAREILWPRWGLPSLDPIELRLADRNTGYLGNIRDPGLTRTFTTVLFRKHFRTYMPSQSTAPL